MKKQNKPDSEGNGRQNVKKAKPMSEFLHLLMKPIKHKYEDFSTKIGCQSEGIEEIHRYLKLLENHEAMQKVIVTSYGACDFVSIKS